MTRLFVGLDLPEDIKEHVYSLRGGLEHAKWKDKEKLHVTLHFIGNVNDHEKDEIINELRYVRSPAFEMVIKELGYFAIGEIPHHLWAGIENQDAVKDLNKKIINAMRKAGFENTDKYKFSPHVTLAKLNGTTMDEVFKYIGANNLFRTKPFLMDHFCLYESIAKENGEGKYYRIIEEFPLSLI